MNEQAWKEQAARIIDPASWAVMDSYLKQMLRKYKGQNIGYDPEAFKHKESMAFAGIGESGEASGITTRLFGQFLTWVQEKESTVFIVATANDISKLPAEFLRKGRFDELFFVDLPNEDERKKIFEIHLNKRKKWNSSIDISKLVKESNSFNGADIEAVIKESIENAFIEDKKEITTEDILKVIKTTKSISSTLKAR